MTIKTRFGSLSARLIVSLLLIICVPSFIGLGLLGKKTRDDFRQQAIMHLKNGLEIKSISAANRLDRSVARLRLTTTRIKKELEASAGLALRLSLGQAPKEWYDDKLYRNLYTILKNELLKHSGITEARIINSSGNELIRLIPTPSGIMEKAPDELENKAHRNYFKNTMALPGGGIYIHPITLQKEYKKIIRPLMPVLRMGGKITLADPSRRGLPPKASAAGAQADEVNFGIVIFNIRSEYIFGMRTSQAGSGLVITDENGYYLVHPDEKALWGNELGHSANLFKDEPEFREVPALKEDILNLDAPVQPIPYHDDYHAWQKIHYDESDPSRYWLLFQREGKGSIEAAWEQLVKIGFAGFALFLLIGFGALALIISRTLRPLSKVADAMKRLEDGDLSARADFNSRTEIGKITHAFNSMADWLEKYRSELQESLAISSAMSDTAPDAHIIIKQDGKILSANRATERMFGYHIDKLTGKDIKTLMPRPYNEKEDDYVWDDLNMGIKRVVGFGMKELNAMRNGGEIFRVSVYLGSAKIGREAVFIAVISDISERKRFEAALLESEEKYRNLFESANDAIYLIDPVTAKIVDCNQKAADMDGYSIDELKEMTVLDLHPAEEIGIIPEKFKEVMNKGAVADISDLHHKRKDGRLITIEINASMIEIGEKRLNLSVVRDVTERKRAEEELKLTQFTVDRAASTVAWIGPDAKFLYVNDTMCRTLGYSREELLKMSVQDIDPDFPSEKWPEHWNDIKERGSFTFESRHRTKDGRIFPVEIGVNYLEFQGKEYNCAFSHDITERKQAEEELKEATEFKKKIFSESPIGLAIYDETGQCVATNDSFGTLIGADKEQVLQQNFHHIESWKKSGLYDPAVASIKENVKKRHELKIKTTFGKNIAVDCHLVPFASDGKRHLLLMLNDIRERMEMEDELRASEERFHSLTDAAFEGIVIARDGKIIDANTAFVNIFGYSRSEIIGKTAMDLTAPESREIVKKNISQGLDMPYEATGIRKDGSKFPFEARGKSMTYMGEPARVTALHDITERKREKEKVVESEKKLSAILNNIQDTYYRTDNDGIITMISPSIEQATGWTPEEVIGTNVSDHYVNPDDREQFYKKLAESGGRVRNYEIRMKRKDGSTIWVSTNSQILLDKDGNIIGVEGTSSDITEQKRAENDVRSAKLLLEKTFASLNEAVFVVDPATRTIISSNPAMERIFGYSAEEVIGRNTEFLHVDKSMYEEFGKKLFPALDAQGVLNTEYRMRRKDGTVFITNHTVTEIKDDSGNRTALVSVVRDITAQKLAEKETAKRTKRLQKLSELSMALTGDPVEVFNKAARMIGELLNVRVVCLSEIRDDELYFLSVYVNGEVMSDAGHCPLEITPCATVAEDKKIRVYEKVAEMFPEAGFLKEHNAYSYCGFPAMDSYGEVVAVTCLLDDKPHHFSEEDQDLLKIIGQRIGMEIERQKHLTERKQAEKKIKESRQLLTKTLDSLLEAVFIIDAETLVIKDCNHPASDIFGYDREEMIGRTTAFLYVDENDLEKLKKHVYKAVKEKGALDSFEFRMKRKNGEIFPAERSIIPLEDDKGKRVGWVSVVRDITERKQAEEAIENIAKGVSAETGEEFFRSLVQYLAKNLNAAYVFIGQLSGENQDCISTLAVSADGKIMENFEYELEGTPCINVVGKATCVYPDNVQRQFPEDVMLVDMGVESYMGTPLFDSKGNALGLLAVMDRKPLRNRTMAESMLKIFATRASAELERKRDEEIQISRTQKLLRYQRTLFELAKLEFTDLQSALQKITEAAAKALGIEQVGIWVFNKERSKIICQDLYKMGENSHERGAHLTRKEYPNYFKALGESRVVAANDVQSDTRTRELNETYLIPCGVTSMMDASIRLHEKIAGIVCHEHIGPKREWTLEDQEFAASIADIASLAFESAERKQAEEALKESESNLEKAQEITHLGHWKLYPETGKVEGSDQIFKVFGISQNDATLDAFVTVVHPDDRKYDIGTIQKSIETGEPYNIEHRLLLKDGTVKWVQAIGEPILDETGKTKLLIGTVQDITERKRAEEALIEAKQAAEKANETKTRFVAKTNHELRNPLTSMISMLKLIVSGMCESREQEKEFLKNVYNSSIHLRGLIEHLLDLSVIESGKMKMDMRSVPINDLLELVRQITWIRAKEKGLELTFNCDYKKNDQLIYCDPDRLRELLVNLVYNAIKFTEKGSVSVACMVTHDGEARTLEIIDTGIGIEPDKLQEVFNPFVQAEGHKYGGAGLGLTLAKKLVEAMGGSISIRSKGLGHGTKVTLSLPQAPVEKEKRKKKKTKTN